MFNFLLNLKIDFKSLKNSLFTENHFLPILNCISISLVLLYYGNLLNRNLPEVSNNKYDKINTTEFIDAKSNSILNEFKLSINNIGLLNIAIYTLILIILATFLLLYLIQREFTRIIKFWFVIAYFLVLFFFDFLILNKFLKNNQLFVIDKITIYFLLWNCSILGVNSVLNNGPILIYKITLLWVSIVIACILFILLGSFFCWILIIIITVWDFFAVLSPKGPLKKLSEINSSKTKVLNAILYSSIPNEDELNKEILIELKKLKQNLKDNQLNRSKDDSNEFKIGQSFDTTISETVIKKLENSFDYFDECSIGLGDLVFFTLQIIIITDLTKNLFVIFCSILMILFGLFITIYFLNFKLSALPALPISILLSQFCSLILYYCVIDKQSKINFKLVFI